MSFSVIRIQSVRISTGLGEIGQACIRTQKIAQGIGAVKAEF
jgi:hypothetical protein